MRSTDFSDIVSPVMHRARGGKTAPAKTEHHLTIVVVPAPVVGALTGALTRGTAVQHAKAAYHRRKGDW